MPDNQQRKLLVIDDEEGIVYYVKKIFEKKGLAPYGATDGVTGVDIFKKERPFITLIDVHMPYSPIDGVETLQEIKKIDANALCIMVSYISEKDRIEAAKQSGAAAYLLKPLGLDELVKAIEDITNIKLS